MMKYAWQVALIVAGTCLLVAIFWAVGLPAIEESLSQIGLWFPALVLLYLGAQLAFMAGWWVVTACEVRAEGFLKLFGIYLAGDAINYVVPSGNLAGEPVKAHLLRDRLEFGRALTSIMIHKHAELVSQWLFLAVGLALSLTQFDLPFSARLFAMVVVVGMGVALMVLMRALKKGAFSLILLRLASWKPLTARLKQYHASAKAFEDRIQHFYRTEPRKFAASAIWCLVGWSGGLLETYLILQFLAPTKGWTTAVAVETLAMALNNLFVFVPGRIGSAEGVRVAVFLLLGLTAAEGVAYGLLRRGRELLWTVPGFLYLLSRPTGELARNALFTSPSEN
jgi:uncharacterized protein (TIRG00374 family)